MVSLLKTDLLQSNIRLHERLLAAEELNGQATDMAIYSQFPQRSLSQSSGLQAGSPWTVAAKRFLSPKMLFPYLSLITCFQQHQVALPLLRGRVISSCSVHLRRWWHRAPCGIHPRVLLVRLKGAGHTPHMSHLQLQFARRLDNLGWNKHNEEMRKWYLLPSLIIINLLSGWTNWWWKGVFSLQNYIIIRLPNTWTL